MRLNKLRKVFNKQRVMSWVLSFACLSGLGALTGAAAEPDIILFDDGRFAQGVQIAGIDASGKLPAEMTDAVATMGDELVKTTKLGVQFPDYLEELPLSQFGVQADVENTIRNAMLIGRKGSITERQQAIQAAQQSPQVIAIGYTFDEATVREKVLAYCQTIPRDAVTESVKFDPSLPERFVFSDPRKGFIPDEEAFVTTMLEALRTGNIAAIPAQGQQVQSDGTTTVSSGTRDNTKLICKYETKVSGSANRRYNVAKGSSMINGTILQPGETFSTNDCLGPRIAGKGWKAAPVIEGGTYTDDLGGGICQVSSTLFNAVIRADLEIVEWRHHSWPSSYVPIGTDATISTGGPDFKFKNNTEWPIYLVSIYDENTKTLSMEVWGRPLPNGMTIELESKRTAVIPAPAAVTVTDPKKVRSARNGQSCVVTRIYKDASGKVIKQDTLEKHTYRAFAAYVLATPTPAPTPTPVAPTTQPTQAPTQAPTSTPKPTVAPTPAPTAAPDGQ